LHCETYILIHNRTGRDEDFRSEVGSALHRLVEERIAHEAELWDRQTLLKRAFKRMDEYIDSELRKRNHTFG
jgi:hypothetical protein